MHITSPNNETINIETLSAGYSRIEGNSTRPDIDITRENDGKWYAAHVGSARWHNLNNGRPVGAGFTTRTEAAQWLLNGGVS